MTDKSRDWETLINHQSSQLTEIKNLVGQQKELLGELKRQSKQNWLTLFIAILASIILSFVAD